MVTAYRCPDCGHPQVYHNGDKEGLLVFEDADYFRQSPRTCCYEVSRGETRTERLGCGARLWQFSREIGGTGGKCQDGFARLGGGVVTYEGREAASAYRYRTSTGWAEATGYRPLRIQPPVSFAAGDGKSRKDQHQGEISTRPDRLHHLSPAAHHSGRRGQEKGDIAAQLEGQGAESGAVQCGAVQGVEAGQNDGRIAGSAPQPGTRRDLFSDPYPYTPARTRAFPEKLNGPGNDVLFRREVEIPLQPEAVFLFQRTNPDTVMEGNHLEQGNQLMVAVGSSLADVKAEIHFGRCGQFHGASHTIPA